MQIAQNIFVAWGLLLLAFFALVAVRAARRERWERARRDREFDRRYRSYGD